MTVGRLAAQRLLTKALQVRKRNAGLLLDSLKRIKSIRLHDPKDFGKGCHSRHSEPYFYEAAYQPVVRDSPIPINKRGECVVATEIPCDHSKPKGSVCSKLVGLHTLYSIPFNSKWSGLGQPVPSHSFSTMVLPKIPQPRTGMGHMVPLKECLQLFRVGSVCGPSCSLFRIRLGSI